MTTVPRSIEQKCKAVSRRIEQARLKAGMSLQVTAEKAGMVKPHVFDVCKGKKFPTLPTLFKMARALGCNVRDFFG